MKRLHLICNAHLDPIWQWTWDEGIASTFSTFKSAADLAEEFDYIFCHGEALLYEAIEKNAPELFARIQRLVKEGKWVITGGWYLQPDCNLPSGESIIRQIKTGQKYFMDKFGVSPTVATNYDSFGHSIGLVQIMKKCGYEGYMICRPADKLAFDYPSKFFRWRAPDGSSVVVTRSPSYNSKLGHAIDKIKEVALGNSVGMLGAEASGEQGSETADVDYVLWGVGNHGGGPSRKDLRDIAELKIDGTEILHSTPERLFGDGINVKGEVTTSLITSMPGCYSSMARMKRAHRQTENLYYAIEKMLSVAKMAGYESDLSDMEQAQKKLLLTQFHDTLPGTVVEVGEEDGLENLSFARKIAKEHRTGAFLHLVMGEDVAKDGEYPVFVFNYMPYEVSTPVEVEFMLADQNWSDEYHFVPEVYCDEMRLPTQQIKEASTLNLDWRKRVIFEGKLKPMGITRFDIRTRSTHVSEIPTVAQSSFDELLEESILSAPVSFVMYDDTADPWGMSDVELKAVGRNPVPFRAMDAADMGRFAGCHGELAPVNTIENGEVLTSIECGYTLDRTNALVEYRFYKSKPYVDLKVTVEYAEKNKLVRLRIPAPRGTAVGDGPYVIENKADCEVSFQKWVGVRAEDGIYSVINDGVYAGCFEDGFINITLLRGSGYCIHPIPGRQLYPEDRYLPRIENGRYVFNFRIYKGALAEVSAEAELFNQPPYAVNIFPTGGGKTEVSVSTDAGVIMPTMRISEDGGYVMRFYNPESVAREFELAVMGSKQRISIGAHEILSVKYDGGFKTVHDEILI